MRFDAGHNEVTLTTDVFDTTSMAMAFVRRDREIADGNPNPVVCRAAETEILDADDTAAVILKLGSVAAEENPVESWASQRSARALQAIANNPVAREFFDREVQSAWGIAFPDEPMPELAGATPEN